MSNTYFKFRQFTIHQDRCAMKVTTDGCLFGALVADSIFAMPGTTETLQCLDIGTGTGLLSLMAAQKNDQIKIDAFEIDIQAAQQASENIAASPWPGIIQVLNEDIVNFRPVIQYDYIFSNPPFFRNNLKSAVKAKNDAKHDTSLSLLQLLMVVDNSLAADGVFGVLLPYEQVAEFMEESQRMNLYLRNQISVKQTMKHKFFRGILFFSRKPGEPVFSEIIIKDLEHQYTPEFAAALKEYYLFL